ncbi:MAG: DNA translocase FtsK 4TM domain-containing protein, partial [Candidatus Krumholzibacteria bacterium]|nr:DNA translocase FtsK 4TM domain-containing protein [Candidatus Krumholzibacteria bacterium]
MDVAPGPKRFVAVTGIAFGLFWAVALVSASPADWPFDASKSFRHVSNYAGPLGSLLAWCATELFGRAFAWLLPIWLFVTAVASTTRWLWGATKWVLKTAVFVVLLNALFALTPFSADIVALRGSVGDGVASALSVVLGEIGSSIVLIAALLLFVLGEIGRLGIAWPKRTDTPRSSRSKARPDEPSWGTRWSLPVRPVAVGGRLMARGARATVGALVGAARSLRSPDDEMEEPEIHERAAGSATSADDFDTRAWKPPQNEEPLPIEIITAERKPAQGS